MSQRPISIAAAIVLVGVTITPVSAAAAESDLGKTATAFVDAYVSGDWPRVASHLTQGKLYVYGSDLAEFTSDLAGFKAMFDNDQKVWVRRRPLGRHV